MADGAQQIVDAAMGEIDDLLLALRDSQDLGIELDPDVAHNQEDLTEEDVDLDVDVKLPLPSILQTSVGTDQSMDIETWIKVCVILLLLQSC
jgi:hypothetical protein